MALYYTIQKVDSSIIKALKLQINEAAFQKRLNLHDEWNKNIFMKPGEERLKIFYNYYQKAKGTSYEQDAAIEYFRSMIGANYFKQAMKFLDEWKKPYVFDIIMSGRKILDACKKELSKTSNMEVINSLNLNEEKAKVDSMLMDTKALMLKMISLYGKMTPEDKFHDYFTSSWNKEMKVGIGYGYGYAGEADLLMKNYNSAIENYELACRLLGDRFFYPDMAKRYMESLCESGRYEEAFNAGVKTFMRYNWDRYKEVKELMIKASMFLDKNMVAEKLAEIEEHKKVIRESTGHGEPFPEFKKVPDIKVTDISGKKYSMASMTGKIVLIQFWSTTGNWDETTGSYFNDFYKKYKNDKNMEIISVNSDSMPEQNDKYKFISDFLKQKKWSFPVVVDKKNDINDKFMIEELPCTVFIGTDGKIYYTETEYSGSELVKDFEKIIEMMRKNIK